MKRPTSLAQIVRERHPELGRANSRADAARRASTDVGALVERFRSYGRWRAMRHAMLRDRPREGHRDCRTCAACKADGRVDASVVLDHIEPARVVVARVIDAGGSEASAFAAFCDVANLQGLCHQHDVAKSAAERTSAARAGTQRSA